MILHRNDETLARDPQYRVLSQEEVAAGKESHWPELELHGNIRSLSLSIFKLNHLTALYLNNNYLQTLPQRISELPCLRRLDLSNNKLRYLPTQIGDLVQLRELMLNNNLLRNLPFELGRCFQLQSLGLAGNPLLQEIYTLYRDQNGTRKLLEHMLDNLQVAISPPPPRPWITVANLDRSRPSAVFTVMCYNVLCDRYATRQMYGYCPAWALSWEYRRKGIIDEIRHYAADIITLQEVESDQFYNFFLYELAQCGYEGVFSPKSRAKTMNENERKRVDGCAIFFKPAKFKLMEEHVIEFNQLAMTHAQGSDVMLNRVMTKDNIALAVLLETREEAWATPPPMEMGAATQQSILVSTAHIHWDPEFCDVKLVQTMMLVDQLRRLTANKPRIQLLLCGDFNSLPDSGVIEYLQNGRIDVKHKDFLNLAYKKSLCKMIGHGPDEEMYNHQFQMKSAIDTEIMPYTNYTYDFKGMIDYIFYPRQSMKPLGFLGPIDAAWLKENKVIGCPHPHLNSDHFSLLVELAMPWPLGNMTALAGQPVTTVSSGVQQPYQPSQPTNNSKPQSMQPQNNSMQQQPQQQLFYNNSGLNNHMTYPAPPPPVQPPMNSMNLNGGSIIR